MNQKPINQQRHNCLTRRVTLPIVVLFLAAALSIVWLNIRSGPVFAAGLPETDQIPAGSLTPTAVPSHSSTASGTSPIVGVLVLLAPLVFLAWKSRNSRTPKVSASCCLPVIDENKRPFQIFEDQPVSEAPLEKRRTSYPSKSSTSSKRS